LPPINLVSCQTKSPPATTCADFAHPQKISLPDILPAEKQPTMVDKAYKKKHSHSSSNAKLKRVKKHRQHLDKAVHELRIDAN